MRLRHVGVVLAVALTASCQGEQSVDPPCLSSATWDRASYIEPNRINWIQVMNWVIQQGFEPLEGAERYGDACWTFDANVMDERMTLFVGHHGRIYEEFPPASCETGDSRGGLHS